MKKLRLLVALCATLSLAAWVGTAAAEPVTAPICPSAGTQLSGPYGNLTITGNAYVAGGTTVTVNGNLRIAPGGCLDAFSQG
ncbi:MAG: hypothetical protein ACRDLK_05355, partial [Gaiellaceae bacterium]